VPVHVEGPVDITSGIAGLDVVKTAGSEYHGFLTDEFTVLPPTSDRILATSVEASWTWSAPPPSYAVARSIARQLAESVLVEQHSLAVQQSLMAVGEALLAAIPEMAAVTLRMPNRHHVPVDLTPFGRPNSNEVFVVQDRPYGEIVGTVTR
jgi:urate oxidase